MSYSTYTIASEITPSDTETHRFNALWIGTGGNISINTWEGGTGSDNVTIIRNVPTGTLVPIATYRVNASGIGNGTTWGGFTTDAEGIIGLF